MIRPVIEPACRADVDPLPAFESGGRKARQTDHESFHVETNTLHRSKQRIDPGCSDELL